VDEVGLTLGTGECVGVAVAVQVVVADGDDVDVAGGV
jgi:hypothetical protein